MLPFTLAFSVCDSYQGQYCGFLCTMERKIGLPETKKIEGFGALRHYSLTLGRQTFQGRALERCPKTPPLPTQKGHRIGVLFASLRIKGQKLRNKRRKGQLYFLLFLLFFRFILFSCFFFRFFSQRSACST